MNKLKNVKLFGLVLAGGKSSRMKTDKGQLVYHGKEQVQICYTLLNKFCEQVFISSRSEQKDLPGQKNLPQIHDLSQYHDVGPLGGILSAMTTFPQHAWLVLACDLPFVTEDTLRILVNERNRQQLATAYKSTYDDLPEPLCAIYEPQITPILQKFFNQDIHCPRKIMIASDVHLLTLPEKNALDNVNNPEKFKEITQKLNTKNVD